MPDTWSKATVTADTMSPCRWCKMREHNVQINLCGSFRRWELPMCAAYKMQQSTRYEQCTKLSSIDLLLQVAYVCWLQADHSRERSYVTVECCLCCLQVVPCCVLMPDLLIGLGCHRSTVWASSSTHWLKNQRHSIGGSRGLACMNPTETRL